MYVKTSEEGHDPETEPRIVLGACWARETPDDDSPARGAQCWYRGRVMDPETPPGVRTNAGEAPPEADRGGDAAETAGGGENAGGVEKRQSPRRTLPFGRGAVLQIAGRSHVVGLSDLSEGGALLLTRATASVGATVQLKLSMVARLAEATLPCTVVRIIAAQPGGPQRALAVRFVDPDDEVRASIAAFVARAPGGRRP